MSITPNGTEYSLFNGWLNVHKPRTGHECCLLLHVFLIRANDRGYKSVNIPCFKCSGFAVSGDYYAHFEERLTACILSTVNGIPYNCARNIAGEVAQGNLSQANMDNTRGPCLEIYIVRFVTINVQTRFVDDDNDDDDDLVFASLRLRPTKLEVLMEMVDAKEKDRLGSSWVMSDHECSICMDQIQSPWFSLTVPSCCHVFHEKCLLRWLDKNNTCPLCRFQLPVQID